LIHFYKTSLQELYQVEAKGFFGGILTRYSEP